MHIQIVTFGLQGVTDEEYTAGCVEEAPAFAAVPGLLSKVWLRDPVAGSYGGVKLWANRQAMEDYLKGEIWRSIVTEPTYVDPVSRDFGVIEAATRVTRGYPTVLA